MRIHTASRLVNDLLHFFDKREDEYPLLAHTLENAYYTKEILEAIEKVFDRSGQVKDDASPELFSIRNNIKAVRKQINQNFNKELRRLQKRGAEPTATGEAIATAT